MNKLGKILLGGACLVGGTLFTFKGVKELYDAFYGIPAEPLPKVVISVIKPLEEAVEAVQSES